MRKLLPFAMLASAVPLLVSVAGCNPAPSTATTVPTDTVESLAADPERLKAVREQCRTERHKVSDELCARAAEATNKRFFNDGKVPYTPPEQPPKF